MHTTSGTSTFQEPSCQKLRQGCCLLFTTSIQSTSELHAQITGTLISPHLAVLQVIRIAGDSQASHREGRRERQDTHESAVTTLSPNQPLCLPSPILCAGNVTTLDNSVRSSQWKLSHFSTSLCNKCLSAAFSQFHVKDEIRQ